MPLIANYKIPPGIKINQIKILLIMKLTTCFMLFACLQVSATGIAQTVTLNENTTSLENVLKKIGNQTGSTFLYENKVLEKASLVTLKVNEASLDQALSLCFKGQPLSYKIFENTVVIKEKSIQYALTKENVFTPLANIITGKVTNSRGEPLVGVSVTTKATKVGTSTDTKGGYSIVASENSTLVFSYVGFTSKEVSIGGRSKIDVVMEKTISSLDQVVVVGYGTQKKRDVIGSISTIKAAVFETATGSTNFNSLLQGEAAGVSVQSSSGRLGASVDIKIRGLSSISASTSPLWVIDGVPIVIGTGISNNGSAEQSPMDLINPADILSIDVLKDAAATSIYGSRGSNGVIIVTTKSGKTGKASLSIGYNAGISELPFQKVHFLLDSKKWFEIKDEAKESF
jgi:TonB-dependent SusC/RagA subfamily outer membrane receptor